MRRVSQHAAGVILEFVPLLHEIVAAVIADLVDQFAVRVADLRDVRAVNHNFAAIGHGWFHFVRALGAGPKIVVELGQDREHAAEGLVHVHDMFLGR